MLWLVLATILAVPLLGPAVALAASANQTRIAAFGDLQDVTGCQNATTAWTWGSAAFSWVASDGFHAALQLGDITNNNSSTGADCECLGTEDPGGGCGDIDHSLYGIDFCTSCDDAEAISCAGGTSGLLCEWTRAQALADLLGSVPFLVTPGNRDTDLDQTGAATWNTFNTYFGGALGTPMASGSHLSTVDAGKGGAGNPLGADAFMLIQGAGQRFLIISLHYFGDSESFAWAHEIIARYPGVPTIIITHALHTETDLPDGWTYNAFGIYNGPAFLEEFGDVAQVFLHICGHNHEMIVVEDTTHTWLNIGVMVDYSGDNVITDHTLYDGASSRQLINYGGGGAVGVLTIDVVAGRLSWKVYSPQLGERDLHYTDENYRSVWDKKIQFCGSSRFTMDDGACDDYTPIKPPGAIGSGDWSAY